MTYSPTTAMAPDGSLDSHGFATVHDGRRPPSVRIAARFDVPDAAHLQARAIAEGTTVSTIIRRAVRRELAMRD